jgi:hypothetical protein
MAMIAIGLRFDSLLKTFTLFTFHATGSSQKCRKAPLFGFWIQRMNIPGDVNKDWIGQLVEIPQNRFNHGHCVFIARPSGYRESDFASNPDSGGEGEGR